MFDLFTGARAISDNLSLDFEVLLNEDDAGDETFRVDEIRGLRFRDGFWKVAWGE